MVNIQKWKIIKIKIYILNKKNNKYTLKKKKSTSNLNTNLNTYTKKDLW